MKKGKLILIMAAICMTSMLVSRVTAVEDYVGVTVGDKYEFTATFEYEVNNTGNLTAYLDFSLEILEIQPEANNPTWGDYKPVVFSLIGTWSGTNITMTPLNDTMRKITGTEYNTSFNWNDTVDVYESYNNKYLPSSPKFVWLIPILTGSRTVTLESSTEDAKTRWDEKGVMVQYERSITQENITTGTIEREDIIVALKTADDPTFIIALSVSLVIAGTVAAIAIFMLYKKGKLKFPRKITS
ncbi:MAG: hypothetical protein ACFFCS_28305 [Candidatus Hodarchaeota archaeon]